MYYKRVLVISATIYSHSFSDILIDYYLVSIKHLIRLLFSFNKTSYLKQIRLLFYNILSLIRN